MTFPALTPSSRTWSPGSYPATAWMAINGSESRVRHSTVLIDSELRLTFLAISEADMLALLAHYLQVIGAWTTFTLPGAVWSGVATSSDYLLTGYAWRYIGPPEVVDLACGGHDVTVALRSVVPEASVGPGADLVVRVSIAHAAPVFGRGATLTVQALLAGGTGVGIPQAPASGATLTVAASIAGGTATGNVAAGAALTVTASIVAGGASSDTGGGAALTVATSIVGGSASSDTDFSSVKLLLHMNGSNNSTTITDSSASPLTFTANGDAKISTAQSKFGGASLALDGNGDYLSVSGGMPTKLQIGSSDFTVEFWVYLNGTAQYAVCGNLNDELGSGHWWVILNSTFLGLHGVQFGTGSGTGSGTVGRFGTAALSTATWLHVAVSRSGTSLRCFVDGTQLGSTVTLNNFTGSYTPPFWIGANYYTAPGSRRFFDGYLDELRVSTVARYTANFTPPSAPFPDS